MCCAVATTSLIRSSILSQCAPLFIVLHQCFQSAFPRVLGPSSERVHWKHIAGVFLALLGTILFVVSTTPEEDKFKRNSTGSSIVGDLWGAFASSGYAVYCTFGRKARQRVPVLIHLPTCCFTSMVIVSVVALTRIHVCNNLIQQQSATSTFDEGHNNFCQNHLLGWTCWEYFPRMAYVGFVCGAIAVSMINWSMSKVQALEAATANSAEPVFATVISIVVFGEPIPTVVAMTAAGIIVYAMILCSTKEKKDTIKAEDDNSPGEAPPHIDVV